MKLKLKMSMKIFTKAELSIAANMPKIQNIMVKNNLIVGKLRDLRYGMPTKSFVGLKVKMYTYVTKDEPESKKGKGVNNSVVADELKYENHKNVFFNATYMNHEKLASCF